MGASEVKSDASNLVKGSVDKAEEQAGYVMLKKLDGAGTTSGTHLDAARQGVLDSSVQQRIRDELSKLRKKEQEMQKQMELALEKEDIERQSKPWFGGKDKGQSSVLLQQELERVSAQVEKYTVRDLSSFPELQTARENVIKCYSDHQTRTLDCTSAVDAFRRAIAGAEKNVMATWK
ncbi:hypothetical protein MSPP1_000080 [Malassezia sp. CBS 17886]|nr:hypothetical protein MSPP1_000080 [Malassezia sp. CBS 17886]